jgi:tRNA G18 (ribose-2'-O)-methylase SpoU
MERIESIDDPRIAPYRNLRDRTLRGEEIFLAEGRDVTLRLLESPFVTESILAADAFAPEFERLVGDRIPLYVGPESLLIEVVGFKFHRGVLAIGRRCEPLSFDALMAQLARKPRFRMVICPEITKPENMGLVFRSAGAFGLDAMLVGGQSCDPFSRRCLRVSMGGVLRVPYVKTPQLLADLKRLKQVCSVELAAAVVDPQAEPLADVPWPARAGVLMGNEYTGLSQEWLDVCDRRVTIPMVPGVDSLNLGVSAGIFLYEMTRREQCVTGG